MTNSRVMVSSFTRNRKEIYKSLKKTVRYTKHLKTGPKLDFEFLVTLCQKQRQESWNLPPGVSIIFMVVQE